MEILFKNHYTRSKELAKEIYRYYYFQRKFFIVMYILLIFSFAINLVSAISGHSYQMFIFIGVPVWMLLSFYCYFRQVHTMIRRDSEVHGKEIEVETIVTKDFIQNTASTGAVNKVEFDKIKSTAQTKHFILLRSKANLIYIFRKDTFEIGTKEEFISFLKDKKLL